ncbi:MAG: methyltransferase domain-containing protein, partial [Acidobacteriota bacterium]
MKESSLEYLVCPSCHARFDLTIRSADGGEVMDAELQCTGCALRYPVRSGVPRFIRTDGPGPPNSTAAAFGWEWRAFSRIDEHHERQFLDWIAPADRGIFRDRVVVEGGCGKGRHTRLAARWGARAVIGVDLSDAVDVAFENTRCEKNVHIVQADLLRLPLRPGSCDYAFSVGVLHHLEDPGSGFKSLFRVVRPHGAMSIWVYGAENNAWVVRLVSPLRRGVTARLPPRGLYLLSGAMAVPLLAA